MAWQYSDYLAQTGGTAAIAARLQLHIGEVANALAAPKSASNGAANWSLHDLNAYLRELKAEYQELEKVIAYASGDSVAIRGGGGYY